MFKRRLTIWRIKQFIRQVYRDINGFLLAKENDKHTQPEFTYGEICFHSFLTVLDQFNLTENSIFCDIGSGTGKNVLIAGLYTNAKSVVGIELLNELFEASQTALGKLHDNPKLLKLKNNTEISFKHQDFLTFDFQTPNCFFINATAFISPFWEKLSAKFEAITPGSLVCLVSRPLERDDFELVYSKLLLMTWGFANVFIYRKI